MLQFFRDRLTSVAAYLLLGLLVIPFAFVGVNSYFQTNINNDVASINGEPITAADYQTGFQRYLNRMRALSGANFDITRFDQPVVRREFLDNLIDQAILQQVATGSGLAVSEEELAEQIRAVPAFQVDGQFDPELYQNVLAAQGMTPKRFQRDLALDLVTSQLPQAIFTSSIATRHEVELLASLQNQTRNFRALTFKADPEAVEVEVSPDEISAYYENNAERFMTREQVVIEYLELSADQFTGEVQFDEDALRSRFEQQKARFINPEKRLASHILIAVPEDADEAALATAEQTARDLAERARAGEEFASLASEFSEDSGSASLGGDLGWVEPGIMVSAFEDALYAMEPGSISDPVQTSFGYHVIYLREVQEAEGMSFEEALAQLTREAQEETAEKLYLEQADRLVNLVYEDPSTLEPAARELGLEVLTEGPFGRDGGEGIAAEPQVVAAAYSDLVLLEGASSDPVDLGSNHIAVVRVREHFPAVPKPLEEVRETIVSELRLEAARDAAREQAEALLARIVAGETDLDTAAGEIGVELLVAEKATRQDFQYGLDLITEVFRLPMRPQSGLPGYYVIPLMADHALVELNAIEPGTAPEDEAGRLQLKRSIANSAAAMESSGLVKHLRSQAEVTVFEDQI